MFALDINLEKDLTKVITQRLQALSGRKVEIGMFAEQGQHHSGHSYAGLFKYLSDGDPSNGRGMPARNTLYVTTALKPLSTSPLKRSLALYLKDLSKYKSSDQVLEDVGVYYRDSVRDVFGDDTILAPKSDYTKGLSESPDTPLIETGSLAKKVAYKIDKQSPVEVGY